MEQDNLVFVTNPPLRLDVSIEVWIMSVNTKDCDRQMVEVDLILVELFDTTVTIDLHYNMHTFTIYALISNSHDFIVH